MPDWLNRKVRQTDSQTAQIDTQWNSAEHEEFLHTKQRLCTKQC